MQPNGGKCGKCGRPVKDGHNAATCGKSPASPSSHRPPTVKPLPNHPNLTLQDPEREKPPNFQQRTANYQITLTKGHITKHAAMSKGSFDIAATDIAQDLLLRHLHDQGPMELLTFKGGTALRKMYAGSAGRFSTDLDFSVRQLNDESTPILEWVQEETHELTLGPFHYNVEARRGRPTITISNDYSPNVERVKLDVTPPPWITPTPRAWIPLAIHDQYGGTLPKLSCVLLEENAAEKIVRLNRTTTARDLYDLVWMRENATRQGLATFDTDLIRRLVVLKNWVDKHGFQHDATEWTPGHTSHPFDPQHWLRQRSPNEINLEDLGRLTDQDSATLGKKLREQFSFLSNLDQDEQKVAELRGKDRGLVLRMISELPDSQISISHK